MANASVAIEVSTLGTSKTLQDLKGVELSTSKMVANLKNAKIDLGIKKQFEEANREAQRFHQQSMRLAAQIGARSAFAFGIKELANFGELSEPLKRTLELMTDIGLQMLATKSAMKEMSHVNPYGGVEHQAGNIASNLAGGAIIGSSIASNNKALLDAIKGSGTISQNRTAPVINKDSLIKDVKNSMSPNNPFVLSTANTEKQLAYLENKKQGIQNANLGMPINTSRIDERIIKTQALLDSQRASIASANKGLENLLKNRNITSIQKQLDLPASTITKPSIISQISNSKVAGGIQGALGSSLGSIGLIGGATIALGIFMDELGKLKVDIDSTNKSIEDSGIGIEKLGGKFEELGKQWATMLTFGIAGPNMGAMSDKATTPEQLKSGYAKIRGEQSKSLLENASKDFVTMSDGTKAWIKDLNDFNNKEVINALNKKQFQANDFESVKKLAEETTRLYNAQKQLIDIQKSIRDIESERHNESINIAKLEAQNAQLNNEFYTSQNESIKGLRREALLLNASIEDINTANLKSTIKEIENYRFLRDNPEQLKKMQERGSALGDPTYIEEFTTEFNKLLANTSLTMSNSEKAALAWDIVNKNIQKTVDYGAKSTDIYLNLMKEAGKQDKDIFKMRSILELNKVMKSPSSTKTDKDLAKIQYESDILNFRKQDAISRGRRFGTTERLDYGTQAAFNVIVDQKQKASDPVLKELKNINAQQVNELKLHTAFLAKLIEQGQKVK